MRKRRELWTNTPLSPFFGVMKPKLRVARHPPWVFDLTLQLGG
jgi:hypothetical protein